MTNFPFKLCEWLSRPSVDLLSGKKKKEINFIFTTYPVITRLETCFVFLVNILMA